MKLGTMKAEGLSQRHMTVPIRPPSKGLAVVPDSDSMLLWSD